MVKIRRRWRVNSDRYFYHRLSIENESLALGVANTMMYAQGQSDLQRLL